MAETLTRSPKRVRVTVYLDEVLTEWGKRQEGGLSELLRRLLGEAKQEQEQTPDRYPPELRGEYRRLIDKKLAIGLSADEEQELARVKQRVNEIDRASLGWKQMEAGAAAVDQELADLRRFIESQPKKPGG
ncbi:MAG: hypothetical protein QM758_07540 [Armatimonas sp.]